MITPCVHIHVDCCPRDQGRVTGVLAWHGMVEPCGGAPVAMSGWVLPSTQPVATLASLCLPLVWLARGAYLLVGAAEGWGRWRGHVNLVLC